MVIAHDTDADAHAAQINVLKRLGGSRRAALGLQMADQGRELAAAGIRTRHPDYDQQQVQDALRLLYLGPGLFRAAWPDRELVQP